MSWAVVDSDGAVKQLDARPTAEPRITAADVADAEKLARIIQGLREDVRELQRGYRPDVVEFRDVAITAGAFVRLAHNLGTTRVNVHEVRWVPKSTASNWECHLLLDTSKSDDNVAVLLASSVTAGTATIRIERAG